MKIITNIGFINKIYYFNILKFKFNSQYAILKKIITIIYKFSLNDKKILFLGITKKHFGFLHYLKLKTHHNYIPNNFWLNGLFTNSLVYKNIFLIKRLKFLLNLKLNQNFNLIIMFRKVKVKKEIINFNLLSIVFCTTLTNKFFSFKISNKIHDSLFLLLVYSILNKFQKS